MASSASAEGSGMGVRWNACDWPASLMALAKLHLPSRLTMNPNAAERRIQSLPAQKASSLRRRCDKWIMATQLAEDNIVGRCAAGGSLQQRTAVADSGRFCGDDACRSNRAKDRIVSYLRGEG
jgi:hypothetical protein